MSTDSTAPGTIVLIHGFLLGDPGELISRKCCILHKSVQRFWTTERPSASG